MVARNPMYPVADQQEQLRTKGSIKGEQVVEKWNTLVIGGSGKGNDLLKQIESLIKDADMPGIITGQREISSGMFSAKRIFLVVENKGLRDYHLYIGARDFGTSLDVSWYLTIEPRFLKRSISKYTLGNPQALSSQIDFFSQQDLSAYISYSHHCVTESVKSLMKELEQDPTGLNTKSKGFLELW